MSAKIILTGTAQLDGHIAYDLDGYAKAAISSQSTKGAGRVRVAIERLYPRHSDQQRAYYFAVVVEMIHAAIKDYGNEWDRDATHSFLKNLFLQEDVVGPNGEIVGARTLSLSGLPKDQMTEFIDKCIRWAAEKLLVVIPEPQYK